MIIDTFGPNNTTISKLVDRRYGVRYRVAGTRMEAQNEVKSINEDASTLTLIDGTVVPQQDVLDVLDPSTQILDAAIAATDTSDLENLAPGETRVVPDPPGMNPIF